LALGEAATHLPWLSPGAATLVALAQAPAWELVRGDPGGVLLVVRQAAPVLAPSGLSFFPTLLHDAAVLEGAVRFLDRPGPGFADWTQEAIRPIYQASRTYARLAERLAEATGRCDPDNAWVAGLLAPLGWQAVAAVDPAGAAACLADPALAQAPGATQQRHWQLDQAGIARRLARRWHLPDWLAGVVGYLGLPVETAQTLGADPEVFRVVQLAVGLAQQQGLGLHLAVGAAPAANSEALRLPAAAVEALEHEARSLWDTPCRPPSGNPAGVPLLRELLDLAAANRRLRGLPAQERLESQIDRLHQALQEQQAGEAERLRVQKLLALAEVAAGAGHEINNPLAVISGQAQYLLGHLQAEGRRQQAEGSPDEGGILPPAAFCLLPSGAERALQTIVHQAQRIHQILHELMQFARPPRPQKQRVDIPGLVREVASALGDFAAQRGVRLVCPEPEQPVAVEADPRQVHTALACLLRNAIEAAPAEGWAGVRLEAPAPDRLELVVEDNGPGPAPPASEHLFDPFYSGRQAGRGRGLGLPTAWRLAREHGGDVRFDGRAHEVTRFVLSLPREPLGHAACNGAVHAGAEPPARVDENGSV
jgi:signal transduction histidine kinase